MKFIEQMVNNKINRITRDELLKYSKQYGVVINNNQADKIVGLLRGKNVNIFNPSERAQLVKEIARITNPDVAKQINQLFLKLTASN